MRRSSPRRHSAPIRVVTRLALTAPLATLPATGDVPALASLEPRFGEVELSTGVRLRYLGQGNPGGKTVILLHGLCDSWFSFSRVLPGPLGGAPGLCARSAGPRGVRPARGRLRSARPGGRRRRVHGRARNRTRHAGGSFDGELRGSAGRHGGPGPGGRAGADRIRDHWPQRGHAGAAAGGGLAARRGAGRIRQGVPGEYGPSPVPPRVHGAGDRGLPQSSGERLARRAGRHDPGRANQGLEGGRSPRCSSGATATGCSLAPSSRRWWRRCQSPASGCIGRPVTRPTGSGRRRWSATSSGSSGQPFMSRYMNSTPS